jgi:cytochrome c oxidase cbb3-type subunit III
LALVTAGSTFALQSAAQQSAQPQSKSANNEGQRLFATLCAGCHGLDARGGERAPNIAQRREVQRQSDAELMQIVQEGIPGAGMPAFHSLTDSDVKAVIAYLRTLQGTSKAAAVSGDPVRGKTVFYGDAGCSACHMIAGSGGFIASDLSGYGRTHSVPDIRRAITRPDQTSDQQAQSAVVITHAGQQYSGRIRNQDNFSLQLQSLDGTFHFFLRSDIERVEHNSQALMPSDYGSKLSPQDLNDLVSYLISSEKNEAEPAGKTAQ